MSSNNGADSKITGSILISVDERSETRIHNQLNKYLRNFEKSKSSKIKVSVEVEKAADEIKNVKKMVDSLNAGKYSQGKILKLTNYDETSVEKFRGDLQRIRTSYEKHLERMQNLSKGLKFDGNDDQEQIDAFVKAYNSFEKRFSESKLLTNNNNVFLTNTQQWDKAKDKITSFYNSMAKLNVQIRNPAAMNSLTETMDKIFKQDFSSPKEAFVAISNLQAQFDQLGLTAETTGQKIVNSFKEKSHYFIIEGAIHLITEALGTMYTNVVNLDDALTELKKTTDLSTKGYADFINDAATRAKELGTSIADITNATADVTRLGYSIGEATEISDAILLYKNVADGVNDVSTASDTIISTLKAYGGEITDVMSIVDKFNEVGNRTAISASDIGEILTRSAASLEFAGNDLNEAIGLAVGANSVVRNAERAGTALKTLSLRLRGAKADLEEASLDTDGMASSTSKLREQILALTSQEVDIMLNDTTFKSTYQILEEISKVWEDISDVDQAALLELMGGKSQANILASIITGFDDVSTAVGIANDSAGSALKENELYLDSITGKISVLSSVIEKISSNILDSGVIKFGISALTGIAESIEFITSVGNKLPATIVAILSAITPLSEVIAQAGEHFKLFKNLFTVNIAGFSWRAGSLLSDKNQPELIERAKEFVERYNNGLRDAALYTDNLTQKQVSLLRTMGAIKENTNSEGKTIYDVDEDAIKNANRGFSILGINIADVTSKYKKLKENAEKAGESFNVFKGLWGSLTTVNKYTLGLMGALAIFSGIFIAYNAYRDNFSFEGLSEKFEENLQGLEEAKSKVESLSSEIEENNKKILELQGSGTITLVEDAELQKLKEENQLLEQQLRISQDIEETNRAATLKALEKKATAYFVENTKDYYGTLDEPFGFKVEAEIRQYNNLLEKVKRGNNEFQESLNKQKQELVDSGSEISEMIAEYQNLGVSPDDNAHYASLLSWLDEIDKTLNYSEWYSAKWEEILGKEEFKEQIEILKNFDGTVDELADKLTEDQFSGFIDALIEVGIVADDSRESIEMIASSLSDGTILNPLAVAFDDIETKIEGATTALEKYDAKLEQGSKEDSYQKYQKAYDSFIEEVDKGFVNSNEFWASAELLLGADKLKELKYNQDEIIKQVQDLSTYYQDAEDSGIGFLDAALAKSAELAEHGITIAYGENGINIDVPKEKYAEFAEVMGVTEEQIASFLMAWSNMANIDFYDVDKVIETFREQGFITENNVLLVDKMTEALSNMGLNAKESFEIIENVKNQLGEREYLELEVVLNPFLSEDYDHTINSLSEEMSKVIENSVTDTVNGVKQVDADPLIDMMQTAGYTNEEIRLLLIRLDQLSDVDITNLSETMNGRLALSVNTENAEEIESVSEEVENTIDKMVALNDVNLGALQQSLDETATKTNNLGRTASDAAGKFALLNAAMNGGNSVSGAKRIANQATGTNYAPSGYALTGEEGSELIYDPSSKQAYLVGTHGAEFYNFSGGETVFNADDTKRIFRNSGKNLQIFDSYAKGTMPYQNYYKLKSSVSSTSSSSSSSSSSSKEAAKDAADALKDAADKIQDLLDTEGDKAVEEIEKRIDAIEEEADALKEAAENAQDLADAQNELLKYEAEIAKEAIDNRIDKIKEESELAQNNINIQIDLLNEQLDLMRDANDEEDKALKLQKAKDAYEAAKKSKSARVYTADKGWVWTADPEKVAEAKEELDELLKDYEREAAEKAITDQIEALEKQADTIEEEAKAQQEALEDLADAWDEQLDKLDYTVESYQKYLDYLNKYTNISVGEMEEAITGFGSKVEEVMNLNSQAEAAQKNYESFRENADLEIEKLEELKDKWNEYAKNIKKTLEEYETELSYAAHFSTLSFEEMTNAVEEYMDRVKDAMKLNSQYQAAKDKYDSYASGTTGVSAAGIANVDEQGKEMIVRRSNAGRLAFLEYGDGVLPKNITERLMSLGANPSLYISQSLRGLGELNRGNATSNIFNYSFGDVNLPNVSNANAFIMELEQLVNQRQNR